MYLFRKQGYRVVHTPYRSKIDIDKNPIFVRLFFAELRKNPMQSFIEKPAHAKRDLPMVSGQISSFVKALEILRAFAEPLVQLLI